MPFIEEGNGKYLANLAQEIALSISAHSFSLLLQRAARFANTPPTEAVYCKVKKHLDRY
jgi:hypothetical protein